MHAHSTRRGFTLPEVMVTTVVVGLLTTAVLSFVFSTTRMLFTSEQKLLINSDVRELTNEMVENARESNYFVLYQSFHQQTQTDNDGNSITVRRDANNNALINSADRRTSSQSGSFLVFVYYRDPYYDSHLFNGDSTDDPNIMTTQVERLVGYWIAPNRDIEGETAVYKFDTDATRTSGATTWTTAWGATLPATLSDTSTIESLLPPDTATWSRNANFDILVNDANGLADGGYIFTNFHNRSALVRMKILHGNQAKRVTNTYNFTITPRG